MSGLLPNARSRRIVESATLAISATAARLKAEGKDVVSLGAGEPDFPVPAPIAAAGVRAIQEGNYRYTPAPGVPELRAAGARWLQQAFGLSYGKDEVMVCAGAKAALHMALAAIVEPGDRVLILAPYWVSYPALVTMADGVPAIVPAVPEQGFVHTPEQVAAAIAQHGAKGIILNFPNNPSGMAPTREQVQAIVDTCLRHGLWIVSDEIYRRLVYEGEPNMSPVSLAPRFKERTAIIDGASKAFAMTGYRIGFVAAPQPLAAAVGRLHSQLTGSPNAISQAAYLAGLQQEPPEVAAMCGEFQRRRDILVKGLEAIGLRTPWPRGAFYAFPDVARFLDERGSKGFCEDLLEQQNLAVVPGSAFELEGYIRLSYATSIAQIELALERLGRFVASHPRRG